MNKHCIWSNQCGGSGCESCPYRDDGTDRADIEFYVDDLNDRHLYYLDQSVNRG